VIDGFLARRFQISTRAGAYFDPIADKILLSVIYVSLGLAGAMPWWMVAVVFGRDVLILAMAGLRLAVHFVAQISAVGVGKDQHFLSDCGRAGSNGRARRHPRARSRWPFV
jgi:phosphatidylglycerophosphate synthase